MTSTVLVTDAGLGSAVSVIRSLGRKGMRVVAADSERHSAGLRSRFADVAVHYPSARVDPDGMIERLLEIVRSERVDLVVPVTDDTILPLAAARDRFERVTKVALPPAASWETARDKEATHELAERLGVPVPRTALVETVADARREAARLGWPVVLKPQASRVHARGDKRIEAFSVAYAGGFARLDARMRTFEGRCPVLLQEYFSGEAHGVELLLDRGRPLLAFQHRRLREVPITGGASSFRESVALDPLLYEYSLRLLAELEWTGLAMVEFKLTPDGPRLMEINGRIWGSLPLAVKSGVDFPAGLAALYLGTPPPARDGSLPGYRLGVRSRHLELETVWIASVLLRRRRYPFLAIPPRREALSVALRLLAPSDGYDILDRDDAAPGVAEVRKILGKPLRRRRGGS